MLLLSICLSNKNAEAVKFLKKIKKKICFPGTKKEFFCKRKKDFFHTKKLFYKTCACASIFIILYHKIIHVHLYSLFIPSFRIFVTHYSSGVNRSSFPETLLCYALNEIIDIIHFFLSK